MSRGIALSIPVVLGLVVLVPLIAYLSILTYVDVNTVVESIAPNITVKYSPPILTNPSFTINLVSESDSPVRACLTVYGLMPNGTLAFLTYKCGSGSINLNYTVIKQYAELWRNSLRAMGNDPDIAEPGLIILGAAVDSRGLHPFVKGLTINTTLIVRNYNAATKLQVRMGSGPYLPTGELRSILNAARSSQASFSGPITMQSWPPRNIYESCYTDPNTGLVTCYIWKLDTIYYSATFTGIPLAMVYVTGNAYKINYIDFYEDIFADSSSGIYVNFAAGAEVDVKSGSSISTSYSADIYTWTLTKSNTYLNYKMSIHPSGPMISAIGFIGNYSIARYKLYACIFSIIPTCIYLNENATMVLAVPVLKNNAMIRWNYNDTNSSSTSYLGQIFSIVMNHWNPSSTQTSTYGIFYTSYDVVREVYGIDLLSVAISLLKEVPVSPTVAASLVAIDIELNRAYTGSTSTIYANYYYTPVRYEWNGNYYYIPAMYVYARVS